MSNEIFNATGRIEANIGESSYYVQVEWSAPLRVTNSSFDHEYGTQTGYSLEQEVITPEDIELLDVYVIDRNDNEVAPTAFLTAIKIMCLKQYDKGNYSIEEV